MIADGSRSAGTTAFEVRVVTGAGGGPEKTILNTPRFLRDYGYETTCVYMHPPDDPGFETLRRRATQWDAPLVSIPDRGLRDFRVLTRIAGLCRRHQVKIWHGHDYKSNVLGVLLRPFHRMKMVTTVHGWVNQEDRMPLYNKIDRWCLPRYQRVICVSEDLFDQCTVQGIPPSKLRLIENAIDENQFCASTAKDEAKRRFKIPPERLLIGAVGRLAEEKGFHLLIPAFARLVAEGHVISLVIAGEGTARSQLLQQIGEHRLTDHVHLLGFQEDTLSLFQAMDIFCLSSLREGLPNVLLEALACEIPTISTDLVGVRQVIAVPGRDGLVVPAGDVESLYDGLKQLVTSPPLRHKLSKAGRQRILERFSFRRRMNQIADMYDELMATSNVYSNRNPTIE